MNIRFAEYNLIFKFEAKTSRETFREKPTWFVRILDEENNRIGIGEAPFFESLAPESKQTFLGELSEMSRESCLPRLSSAARFGYESAMKSLEGISSSPFTLGEKGIKINGLIWMGDCQTMRSRIDEKLDAGFRVLKLKIGGIDFEEELSLIKYIRKIYSSETLELRLDANGSFSQENALERLNRLSVFNIHSLEQPIMAGNPSEMRVICAQSPVAIALDEELIGVRGRQAKEQLLEAIQPQYVIIKPSLCGGLSDADEWADVAEEHGVGWWATSALESNVGLFAIADWLYSRGVSVPQGLGTGQLYKNNVNSPLELRGDLLFYNPQKTFDYPDLKWVQ